MKKEVIPRKSDINRNKNAGLLTSCLEIRKKSPTGLLSGVVIFKKFLNYYKLRYILLKVVLLLSSSIANFKKYIKVSKQVYIVLFVAIVIYWYLAKIYSNKLCVMKLSFVWSLNWIKKCLHYKLYIVQFKCDLKIRSDY